MKALHSMQFSCHDSMSSRASMQDVGRLPKSLRFGSGTDARPAARWEHVDVLRGYGLASAASAWCDEEEGGDNGLLHWALAARVSFGLAAGPSPSEIPRSSAAIRSLADELVPLIPTVENLEVEAPRISPESTEPSSATKPKPQPARPSVGDLLNTPGALLTTTDLAALGHSQRAVEAIFRELDTIVLPGFARPYVRASDYNELIRRNTYRDGYLRPASRQAKQAGLRLAHRSGTNTSSPKGRN